MKKEVNFTILGIVVVSLSVMLVAFFFWLATDKSGIESYNTYLLRTNESVTGLMPDSAVLFSGVKVGYVRSIAIDKANPDMVDILIRVDKKILITTSTVAALNTQGITGVVNVGLKAKDKSRKRLVALAEDQYPIIPVEKSLLAQLSNLVPKVSENLTKSMLGIQRILSKHNTDNMSSILSNVQKVTAGLSDSQAHLLKKLDSTLGNIDKATNSVEKSAHALDKSAASGHILIDNITQQTLPSMSKLLNKMNATTDNFKQLSQQLNHNPSVLIRGKLARDLGPGEK